MGFCSELWLEQENVMKVKVEKNAPMFAMDGDDRYWELTNMDLRAGTEVVAEVVDRQYVRMPNGAICDRQLAQFKEHGTWFGILVEGDTATNP